MRIVAALIRGAILFSMINGLCATESICKCKSWYTELNGFIIIDRFDCKAFAMNQDYDTSEWEGWNTFDPNVTLSVISWNWEAGQRSMKIFVRFHDGDRDDPAETMTIAQNRCNGYGLSIAPPMTVGDEAPWERHQPWSGLPIVKLLGAIYDY